MHNGEQKNTHDVATTNQGPFVDPAFCERRLNACSDRRLGHDADVLDVGVNHRDEAGSSVKLRLRYTLPRDSIRTPKKLAYHPAQRDRNKDGDILIRT